MRVIFYRPWLFKLLPDVWRLATPFLFTSGGLGFIFDLYFLWTYGTGLELNSPRFSQPGDFFTYLVFVCSTIMATAGLLLEGHIFTHALTLALAYTYATDNRGKRVTFIMIQIPVEYLPWAMLTFTLVMSGWPAALQEGMGIIAAHLYDFLTRLYPTFQGGRNWIQTPAFVARAFGADRSAFSHKAYGTSFRSAAARPAGQQGGSSTSSGWTSALGGTWGGRGAGRRLGGG